LEIKFELEGGQAFEDRKKIERGRRSTADEFRSIEDDLRRVGEGPAPLIFVKNLLASVAEQDLKEQQALELQLLDKILAKRDGRVVSIARASGTSKTSVEAIGRFFLLEDRDQRKQSATNGIIFTPRR